MTNLGQKLYQNANSWPQPADRWLATRMALW